VVSMRVADDFRAEVLGRNWFIGAMMTS
jgi:hypothetical protein